MGKYDHHFRMTEQEAAEYAKEQLNFFSKESCLSCMEIGDGNMNYVFRVLDEKTGQSIIIKQADEAVRSTGRLVSTDRNRIEAEILKIEGQLAKGFVPEVYFYDPIMCCLVMEDLRDYENMRRAMIKHNMYLSFAEDITTFLAETLIKTTDLVMDAEAKKRLAVKFTNPELCKVTERLVFTEPYLIPLKNNNENTDNQCFFQMELFEDKRLHLEVAKLKESFKGKPQALLHGDLHTGSILIKEDSTMILDPEFAFYGPIGYDLGNVIANLLFAWVNAKLTMEEGEKKSQFLTWMEETIEKVIDRFLDKARRILEDQTIEPMAQTEGFIEWYLTQVLQDTAGMAGTELNRRIVGSAKVKDITGIVNRSQRNCAERICVLMGKKCIMNRKTGFLNGHGYVNVINQIAAEQMKG